MGDPFVLMLLAVVAVAVVLLIIGNARMDETIGYVKQTTRRTELYASSACKLIKELQQEVAVLKEVIHASREQHSPRRDEDPACPVRSDLP